MQRRYWYAVRKSHNDDMQYGSRNYHEAMDMLEAQGSGFISVVVRETADNYIEGEIEYEMFFGDNPLVKKGTREWKEK